MAEVFGLVGGWLVCLLWSFVFFNKAETKCSPLLEVAPGTRRSEWGEGLFPFSLRPRQGGKCWEKG